MNTTRASGPAHRREEGVPRADGPSAIRGVSACATCDTYAAFTSVQASVHADRFSGGVAGIAFSQWYGESSDASWTSDGGATSSTRLFDTVYAKCFTSKISACGERYQ